MKNGGEEEREEEKEKTRGALKAVVLAVAFMAAAVFAAQNIFFPKEPAVEQTVTGADKEPFVGASGDTASTGGEPGANESADATGFGASCDKDAKESEDVAEDASGEARPQDAALESKDYGEARGEPEPPKKPPYIALLIDDGGWNLDLAKRAASCDVAATWAVIPYLKHSRETLDLAKTKNVPCLIHIPMQAQADKSEEDKKNYIIGSGMTEDEVTKAASDALEATPGVVGANNHRGSLATRDEKLMKPVMEELKRRGLFFVDSRTTPDSVAYGTARDVGVRALKNRGFLDNSDKKEEIAKRFDELAEIAAKRGGGTVIICHFRPATLEFLEELSQKENLPVSFVTLPEMFGLIESGAIKDD